MFGIPPFPPAPTSVAVVLVVVAVSAGSGAVHTTLARDSGYYRTDGAGSKDQAAEGALNTQHFGLAEMKGEALLAPRDDKYFIEEQGLAAFVTTGETAGLPITPHGRLAWGNLLGPRVPEGRTLTNLNELAKSFEKHHLLKRLQAAPLVQDFISRVAVWMNEEPRRELVDSAVYHYVLSSCVESPDHTRAAFVTCMLSGARELEWVPWLREVHLGRALREDSTLEREFTESVDPVYDVVAAYWYELRRLEDVISHASRGEAIAARHTRYPYVTQRRDGQFEFHPY